MSDTVVLSREDKIAARLGFEATDTFESFCGKFDEALLDRAYGLTFDKPGLESPEEKRKYFIGTLKSLHMERENG